ncbi:MAG: sigma-54 dependent transcriptional regulator [Calditrichia bacterium]
MNKIVEIQKKFNIIGESEAIRDVIETISNVAASEIPVLILGESGAGKEVVANAIHHLSKRKDKKMVSVNCGAIPEGLIESELFGHEKGAFTGAVSSRAGYFEIADKGTIFLDEVGELPVQTQVKLLRVLETGEFMRVGGTSYKTVDVRLIAATNRDVEAMVEENKFRRDLYYRLKGVTIVLPALRERKEDIPLFVEHFKSNFEKENSTSHPGFTAEALYVLQEYPWPGNIRELKNAVETLLVLHPSEKISDDLVRQHLNFYSDVDQPSGSHLPVVTNKTVDQAERELIYRALLSLGIEMTELKKLMGNFMHHIDQKLDNIRDLNGTIVHQSDDMPIMSINEMEKRLIKTALEKFHGNRKKIADALEISERTLYRKIKDYGLE